MASAFGRPVPGPMRSVHMPLHPGQVSQIRKIARHGDSREMVLEVTFRLEAAPDGRALILNGGGKLFRLSLRTATLDAIPIEGIEDAKNDHVLSPDGETLYLSAGGAIWSVPVTGGKPMRLSPTNAFNYYLHGVSPDGRSLACTVRTISLPLMWGIHLLSSADGSPTPVIQGPPSVDGPEWSPDEEWIWFNGQLQAEYPKHAQIFRMRADGTELTQVVASETVDWFPHISPDSTSVAYFSYPKGTEGHPANLGVEIRLLDSFEQSPDSLADRALST